MTIEEIIESRRSQYTGQFSGKKVDNAHVEKMLMLANWAPTHKHTEPWRFEVFEGEALHRVLDMLCEVYIKITPSQEFNPAFVEKMQSRKELISHLIIVVMNRNEGSGLPEFEEIASTAMAVQNMWLYTAQFPEIGGYWSTPKVVLSHAFHEQIGLKENQQCLGMFLLGSIKEDAIEPVGKRGDWKEKVKWHKN